MKSEKSSANGDKKKGSQVIIDMMSSMASAAIGMLQRVV